MNENYEKFINLNKILEETNRKMDKLQNSECLHLKCPECHGTGVKKDGTPCIHMISCPCSKCNPKY